MATYRFVQAGDRTGIQALFTPAMIQELRDDYGTFAVPDFDAYNHARFRIVVGLDNSNVIRGATLLEQQTDGRWQICLTVADKSLSANQRVTHFRLMTGHMARQVPASVVIFGRVKIGGRLDTYLSGQPFTRTLAGDLAEFEATAGVIAGVF